MTAIPFIKDYHKNGGVPPEALIIPISEGNWTDVYPYSPEAKVFLWHDGKNFFLKYEVNENYIKALTEKDNGKVCKDSCVECFIAFDNQGYYNIEANCIGKILMRFRKDKATDVVSSDDKILSGIKRYPSLGSEKIEGREINESWTLTLEIPVETFWRHNFDSLKGLKASCNFYKCGDELPRPHYLSWKKINTETPDFHRPDFFGEIQFEE